MAETVAPCKLDALGPIILNTDGSMSRIPNWTEMTAQEQDSAIRLITARNERRRKVLLEEKARLKEQGGGGAGMEKVMEEEEEEEDDEDADGKTDDAENQQKEMKLLE